MRPLAKSNGTPYFDPAEYDGNTLQAFTEFIESWEMWYDVASIGELKEDATDAQKKEHRARVFKMCAFTGERLKTDLKAEYNQDMAKITSADFDYMVKKLHDRYRPAQNQVLLHYQLTRSNKNQVRKLMLLSIKSANMLINVHSSVQTHHVLRKIKFIRL